MDGGWSQAVRALQEQQEVLPEVLSWNVRQEVQSFFLVFSLRLARVVMTTGG